MTRDEILELLNRRQAAWAAHDSAALAATHTVDGIVASPLGGALEGRAEIQRIYALLFSAFPDIVMQQDELVIDGDRVVVIARMAGTHAGHFFGLEPTGRRMEFLLAQLMTVADGLVKEERRIYDFTGVLLQVGVLKAKPMG